MAIKTEVFIASIKEVAEKINKKIDELSEKNEKETKEVKKKLTKAVKQIEKDFLPRKEKYEKAKKTFNGRSSYWASMKDACEFEAAKISRLQTSLFQRRI